MSSARLRLAPGVPDLAALGAESVEDLLGDGRLLEEARAQVLEERDGAVLLRCPLPGTPGAEGRLTGSPRGAGTGWMRLRRYRGPSLGELAACRFTAPRSLSAAEREWNLFCRLRECGVSTPELLAVAAAGGGPWSRRSVLVTREPDPARPLPEWLAAARARHRARGLEALGHALARVAAGGVELPELAPHHLVLAEPAAEDCAAEQIDLLRAGARGRLRATPDVVVGEVRRGRLRPGPVPVAPLVERALAGLGLTRREGLRVLRAALPADLDRGRRRAALGAGA